MQIKRETISMQKEKLRSYYSKKRMDIDNEKRVQAESALYKRMIESELFKNAKIIFTYVSMKDEVDTIKLIDFALEQKKKVAVPLCVTGNKLEFYYILSRNDLHIGAFNVLEPRVDTAERADSDKSTLCIVPGLVFDENGYRIGYGKGYYDRFLENFHGSSLGICFDCTIYSANLPVDQFDKHVNVVMSEKREIKVKEGLHNEQ